MDIEERTAEDDMMEYEEAPSSAGIAIEADGTNGGAPREDEVMTADTTLTTDIANPIVDADGDLDLEAEYEEGGDDMEPEPTPMPGAEDAAADPFFGLGAPLGSVGVIAGETGQGSEGEGMTETAIGTKNPLSVGASGVSHIGDEGAGAIAAPSLFNPISTNAVASSSTSLPILPSAPQNQPEADIAEGETYYEEDADGEEEEYYYEEEAEDEATTTADLKSAAQITGEEGEFSDSESEFDPGYDPSAMLTAETLPTVILDLPNDQLVSLFASPDPAIDLPLLTPSTPIYFAGRHAEFAQAPLAELLVAIRAELSAAGYGDMEGKEMNVQEESLGLTLAEHDKHLANVTLLEYLQLHNSCALPNPVVFHVTFDESRFWDRFSAIQKELAKNAESRSQLEEGKAAKRELKRIEEAEVGEEEDDVDEGAEIEVRHDEHATQDRGGAESAHPHADWAKTLATAPLAYGSGNNATSNAKPREAEATNNDALAIQPSQNKGRSSRKDDDEPADTTEASNTDSFTEMQAQQEPMDEVALKRAGLHALSDETPSQVDADDEEDVGAEEAIVPKDEIALKEDWDESQRSLDTAAEEARDTSYVGKTGTGGDIDTESGVQSGVLDTPLGDVELAEAQGEISVDTPLGSTEEVLASGLVTPAEQSEAGAGLPGSSLANEVLPEEYAEGDGEEDEAAISTIPEEAEETTDGEYPEETEEGVYDEGDEEVYEEGVEGEEAEEAEEAEDGKAVQRLDDGEKAKTALQIAVEDGLIPRAAAEAVDDNYEDAGGEEDTYDEVTDEAINPFAKPVAGEVSPATSTTVEDDDEYYGDEVDQEANEEQANPLGSAKRPAEDDDEETTASVKRTRFPAQV